MHHIHLRQHPPPCPSLCCRQRIKQQRPAVSSRPFSKHRSPPDADTLSCKLVSNVTRLVGNWFSRSGIPFLSVPRSLWQRVFPLRLWVFLIRSLANMGEACFRSWQRDPTIFQTPPTCTGSPRVSADTFSPRRKWLITSPHRKVGSESDILWKGKS